uniref:Secreted protein n=1 Tax=Timema tahoe TaxID=61484 RepID=A0A7R9NXK4_9NEOP|nr:unnamed protein product [Timema tahoe]
MYRMVCLNRLLLSCVWVVVVLSALLSNPACTLVEARRVNPVASILQFRKQRFRKGRHTMAYSVEDQIYNVPLRRFQRNHLDRGNTYFDCSDFRSDPRGPCRCPLDIVHFKTAPDDIITVYEYSDGDKIFELTHLEKPNRIARVLCDRLPHGSEYYQRSTHVCNISCFLGTKRKLCNDLTYCCGVVCSWYNQYLHWKRNWETFATEGDAVQQLYCQEVIDHFFDKATEIPVPLPLKRKREPEEDKVPHADAIRDQPLLQTEEDE